MPRLIPLSSALAAAYELAEGETRIGRRPTNHLEFLDGTVSGEHARITTQGGECYLEDLRSRNGTFVNGQRITERAALRPGDVVAFGEVQVRFEADQARRLRRRAEPGPRFR